MHKNKKILIIGIIAALAVFLIGFTILSNLFKKKEVEAAVINPVITALPVRGEIQKVLFYSGNLIPAKTVTIISKVAGKIEEIFVKEGDFVTKEQVLIRIEDEIVSFQKEQAFSLWRAADAQFSRAKKGVRTEELQNTRALVKQAEVDLFLATENFTRTERLYKSGAIAKSQYEEAENAIKAANTKLENAGRSLKLMEQGASAEEIEMAMANAEAARAQYEMARLQADNTSVQAPELGLVAKMMVDEGNLVGTTTPIMAIVRIDPIIARIPIPELHYNEILQKRDQVKITVYPNAFPGTTGFRGKITSIAPIIDPASRTFSVEIEIPNPLNLLRPGMYANVELTLETFTDTLLLPRSAVVKRNGREVVFVAIKGNSLHSKQVDVTTGIADTDKVQILSGIDTTDNVIVEGNLFLEDGQEVRVKAQL